MGKKKEEAEREASHSLKITGFLCMTVIAVVALIGGFWGADGFRVVGIGIACLMAVLMSALMMWGD